MEALVKSAEVLIEKASATNDPVAALQFSQAACNVANAIASLKALRPGS